jgi:hypothetical protein
LPCPPRRRRAIDPHLKIVRHGITAVDRDLYKICGLCLSLGTPADALHIRNLDSTTEPEVLVDFFTGGAHCCWSTAVFSYAKGGYLARTRIWGNGFYRLLDLDGDGRPEFVGDDDRFAYTFAAYAFSLRPVRIFDFVGHRFVNRTRRFPARVRSDLKGIDELVAAAGKDDDLRGAVAARVADLYLLGRGAEVDDYLAAQLQAGHLDGDATWPAGAKFKPALLKFLRETGYIK